MEEVGLGQCDACCQQCFRVFSFSVMKCNLVTAGASQIPNAFLVEVGFRARVPLKAKSRGSEGSGGRGLRLGIAGRACEASVGESCPGTGPLWQVKGRGVSVAQGGRVVPACVCGGVSSLWSVFSVLDFTCVSTSSLLSVLSEHMMHIKCHS